MSNETEGNCQERKERKNGNSVAKYVAIYAGIYYVILNGIKKTDGIFYYQLQNEIRASDVDTTLIYSVAVSLFFIGGPIYGAYFKILGARVAILTAAILCALSNIAVALSSSYICYLLFFSITRGIGSGLAYLSIYTITGQTFKKHLSLVNNSLASISSLYAITLALLLQMGIDYYNWQGTMLILGGVMLNLIPIGWITATMFDRHVQQPIKADIPFKHIHDFIIDSMDVHLLRDSLFVGYCIANCCVDFPLAMHGIYLVRYAQYLLISDKDASFLLSVYQFMYMIMAIVSGVIISKVTSHAVGTNDGILFKTSTMISLITLGQCATSFIPLIWDTYRGYFTYVILAGAFAGAFSALPITIIPELFGKKSLASAIGFRGLFFGIFILAIPPIVGKLVDVTGTYRPCMFASVFFALLGSILFYVLQKNIDRRNNKNLNKTTN